MCVQKFLLRTLGRGWYNYVKKKPKPTVSAKERKCKRECMSVAK